MITFSNAYSKSSGSNTVLPSFAILRAASFTIFSISCKYRIPSSFPSFNLNNLTKFTRASKLKHPTKKKLDFSKYFYSDELWDIEDEYYNDAYSTIFYENYEYEQLKIDELLPKLKKDVLKKVLDYAFESQRGNKLLIITFFTRNKIENKEFIQELQKNYGIYLDVDIFIKEMNQALKDIKTYKQLFEYIGDDFAKNMNEEDIIINCYKKAKEKKYINLFISFLRNSDFYKRGRGFI